MSQNLIDAIANRNTANGQSNKKTVQEVFNVEVSEKDGKILVQPSDQGIQGDQIVVIEVDEKGKFLFAQHGHPVPRADRLFNLLNSSKNTGNSSKPNQTGGSVVQFTGGFGVGFKMVLMVPGVDLNMIGTISEEASQHLVTEGGEPVKGFAYRQMIDCDSRQCGVHSTPLDETQLRKLLPEDWDGKQILVQEFSVPGVDTREQAMEALKQSHSVLQQQGVPPLAEVTVRRDPTNLGNDITCCIATSKGDKGCAYANGQPVRLHPTVSLPCDLHFYGESDVIRGEYLTPERAPNENFADACTSAIQTLRTELIPHRFADQHPGLSDVVDCTSSDQLNGSQLLELWVDASRIDDLLTLLRIVMSDNESQTDRYLRIAILSLLREHAVALPVETAQQLVDWLCDTVRIWNGSYFMDDCPDYWKLDLASSIPQMALGSAEPCDCVATFFDDAVKGVLLRLAGMKQEAAPTEVYLLPGAVQHMEATGMFPNREDFDPEQVTPRVQQGAPPRPLGLSCARVMTVYVPRRAGCAPHGRAEALGSTGPGRRSEPAQPVRTHAEDAAPTAGDCTEIDRGNSSVSDGPLVVIEEAQARLHR
jgi:hypothetical protein